MLNLRRLLALGALLPALACSSNAPVTDAGASTHDAGGKDAGPPPVDAGTEIGGSCGRRTHWVQDGGATDQLIGCNLNSFVIKAATIDEDGGIAFYPDFPLGTDFTISGVPAGHFYLNIPSQNFWIYTDQRSFVLESNNLGTPTLNQAGPGTQLAVSGTGMPAWQSNDVAGIFSWNADDLVDFSGLLPGQSSFSSSLIDFGGLFLRLIDTSAGDDLLMFHEGTTEAPSYVTFTLDSVAYPSPVVMTNGQTTSAPSAAFTAVPLTLSTTLSFGHAAVEDATGDVNPQALLATDRIDLCPILGGTSWADYPSSPYLLRVYDNDPSDTFTQTFSYGNPFGAQVGVLYYHQAQYSMLVGVSGATPTYQSGYIVNIGVEGKEGSPDAPSISPPTNLLVNGQPASGGLMGIGTAPIVSWSPPSTGTANAYEIHVLLVAVEGGETVTNQVAQVRTDTTSVQIPPGILTSTGTYIFSVRAFSMPSVNMVTHPYTYALPESLADALSGLLTP